MELDEDIDAGNYGFLLFVCNFPPNRQKTDNLRLSPRLDNFY